VRVAVSVGALRPETGGGYTIQDDLLAALAKVAPTSEHDFVVVADTRALPAAAQSLPVIDLSVSRAASQRRAAAGRLREAGLLGRARWRPSAADRVLQRQGIDLLWCFNPGAPSRELPYIAMVWDVQHRRDPFWPELAQAGEWARRERFWSEELRRAARVVVGTATGASEVERYFGVEPAAIRVLPHPTPGFALSAPPEAGSVPSAVRTSSPFILYPAQYWAHKNHVTLVRALARIRARGGDLRLVFTGSDKGNRARVEDEVTRLGLTDHVDHLGFVTNDELVALYRSAVAMTYASACGPENLPPLEAFALGCPVIASDIPGAREQLGDAAELVRTTDEAAWADAIERVWRDQRRARALVRRGRTRAQRWTAEDWVRDGLGIVDELGEVISLWRRA